MGKTEYAKGGEKMPRIPINAARVAAGLTQEQLADEMGVSRSTVAEWESGDRVMRVPYVKLFCLITGFTADDLILPENNT